MKRIWIWMLCVVLAFSLTACNGCNETADPVTDPDTSTTDGGDTTDTDGGDTTDASDSTTSGTGADATGSQGSGSGNKTEGTSGDKTGSTGTQSTSGKTQSSSTTSGTGTTKTTKKSSTGTVAATDNFVDWGEAFGTDPTTTTTTKKGDTTASTTTTTTTTTKPTTTTTVAPTVVNEVKLPAVGTDVDVARQKGRIRVSAIDLKDGKVTISIKNENKNWITQETDWVKYACFDKDGKELKGEGEYFGTIYLGCMETGEVITETFTLPAGTVEVRLVDSEIVYWTPWS